ncbi:hypothetical protein [Lichenicoccus sp.]|uniref:hypothetical protein n=1 Tax=Lichenicoccus sp. TaxID=2781899 RepID=UPI003D0D0F81
MADPSIFDPLRIPVAALVWLDWRPYHFMLQPYHYLIRIAHIVSMSAFFGGIGLLDFRLMGWRGSVPLRSFAEHVLPWLWATFAVAVVTGAALFLYDPVQVGTHAYWTPKLIAIGLGLANALRFHRTGYVMALAAERQIPAAARIAGGVSLACWTMALVFACLNTEGAPKVLLR